MEWLCSICGHVHTGEAPPDSKYTRSDA
ncbi:rubredoxin-like domain-containing protein [Pontiella sulfatireligans]